jgi:hypothetical protein
VWFELNRPGIDAAFLRGLQESFGGWGGPAEFEWWFRRRVGGPSADLLTLTEGDELAAGSAISYRVADLSGADELVAVMTGSWTAPSYRRRGCFGELIERSRETAFRRGTRFLLGISGAHRPSRDPLAAASFATAEAWYLNAETVAPGPLPPRTARQPTDDKLARWFHEHRPGRGFVYAPTDVFVEQARLSAADVVETSDGHWAICERRADTLQIQAIVSDAPTDPTRVAAALATAAAHARRSGLIALGYTTLAETARAAGELGFRTEPGVVYAMPTGDSSPPSDLLAGLAFQALDRA